MKNEEIVHSGKLITVGLPDYHLQELLLHEPIHGYCQS